MIWQKGEDYYQLVRGLPRRCVWQLQEMAALVSFSWQKIDFLWAVLHLTKTIEFTLWAFLHLAKKYKTQLLRTCTVTSPQSERTWLNKLAKDLITSFVWQIWKCFSGATSWPISHTCSLSSTPAWTLSSTAGRSFLKRKTSSWHYISLQDEKFRSALLHLLTSQDVARRLLNSSSATTSHHLHTQTGERRGGKTERDDNSRQDLEFLTEVPPTVTTTIWVRHYLPRLCKPYNSLHNAL